MKKSFVKVALLSMMLVTVPMTFTSCKDYDDDITEINGTTDDLGKQIEALRASIEANKQTAEAAHAAAEAALKAAQEAAAKGDQAEADAQKAMAMAKAAEEAAANAKAEALAEIAKQCEELKALIEANSNSIKENKDAIAALIGRIEGVENGLSKIDIDGINSKIVEMNKALEAVNVQLAALKGYETRIAQLESQFSGLKGDVDEAKKAIADLTTQLQTLQSQITSQLQTIQGQVDQNKLDIEGIKAELTKISEEISKNLQNGLNHIASVMNGRLTSVTLMPDLYVGGIPTIEFKSAKYNALVFKNGQWVESSDVYHVSNNRTEVEYRVSPGTITKADIDMPKFVSRIATTRAAEQENDIVTVLDYNVSNNGILKIVAGKGSNNNSLNLSGNKIYTVSLKVPIAKSHWFENESFPQIYSEYTRLSEIYFQPELRKTNAVASGIPMHFNDSATLYKSAVNTLVAAKVQFNKTLDLSTLVQGCEFVDPDTHTPISQADMKAYGFAVRYQLAKHSYIPVASQDKTDQQVFCQVNGSTFTPGAPTNSGFLAFNQTAIGKQPLVHVWLVDTVRNKMIDSRYLKVLVTREDPTPESYEITPARTAQMGCQNYTFNVTWDDMTKMVLSQMGNKSGISKEEFFNRYGAHAAVKTVTVDNVNMPALANQVTDDVQLDNTGASIPVITFRLNYDQIGTLARGKSKTYVVTLIYKDAKELNPDIIVKFSCVITNNINQPVIGKTHGTEWVNETMKLFPVRYGSPQATANAEYTTNLLMGRLKPLATGMLSCATWNIDFAKSTYHSGATLSFPAGKGGWMDPADANSLQYVNVNIAHDANGISLVQSERKLAIDWSVRLIGLAANQEVFNTSYLQIVKPLKNPTLDNSVVLYDKPYQQTVNLNQNIKLYDAYNELVANTSGMPKNLWNYYGVKSIVFGGAAGEIVITDDMNGSNPVSLSALHMTAVVDDSNNVLKFQNDGAVLQGDAYLQIPVEVNHYWGKLTGKIYIKIQHSI